MKKVLEFLKENPTYYLTTVDGDKPQSRPFGTIAEFEGMLYFQTGMSKNVFKQIKANPNIQICTFNGKDCWLRLSATAIIDERPEVSDAILNEYPSLRAMYTPGDGNCVAIGLKDVEATFFPFATEGEIEVHKF